MDLALELFKASEGICDLERGELGLMSGLEEALKREVVREGSQEIFC